MSWSTEWKKFSHLVTTATKWWPIAANPKSTSLYIYSLTIIKGAETAFMNIYSEKKKYLPIYLINRCSIICDVQIVYNYECVSPVHFGLFTSMWERDPLCLSREEKQERDPPNNRHFIGRITVVAKYESTWTISPTGFFF
jgi:hypothetical protein